MFEGLALGLEESNEDVWTLFTGNIQSVSHLNIIITEESLSCCSHRFPQVCHHILRLSGAAAERNQEVHLLHLPNSVQPHQLPGYRHRHHHHPPRGWLRAW